MSKPEEFFEMLHGEEATPDDFDVVARSLGRLIAHGDAQELAAVAEEVPRLQDRFAPGTWQHGYVEAFRTLLQGALPKLERKQRLKVLVDEVWRAPLWVAILRELHAAPGFLLHECRLSDRLVWHAEGVRASPSDLPFDLQRLETRALVESWVDADAQPVWRLTRLGRQVHASCQFVASVVAKLR